MVRLLTYLAALFLVSFGIDCLAQSPAVDSPRNERVALLVQELETGDETRQMAALVELEQIGREATGALPAIDKIIASKEKAASTALVAQALKTSQKISPRLPLPPVHDGMVLRKPAIYLYGEENIRVEIELPKSVIPSFVYPPFNLGARAGWLVTLLPQGRLSLFPSGSSVEYLFWEGKIHQVPSYDPNTGYYVRKNEVITFLEQVLSAIGLNSREAFDFIVYWGPILSAHELNYVHFLTTEYHKKFPLTVTPEPDSILQLYMLYQPVISPQRALKPQQFPEFKRRGFTVVEWGGGELL